MTGEALKIRRALAPAPIGAFLRTLEWPAKIEPPEGVLCALSVAGGEALIFFTPPAKLVGCRCGLDPLNLVSTLAWLGERWPDPEATGWRLATPMRQQIVARLDLKLATEWCVMLALVFEQLRRPPGDLPPIPDVLRNFGG